MQQDPLESQAKNVGLPQENREAAPNPAPTKSLDLKGSLDCDVGHKDLHVHNLDQLDHQDGDSEDEDSEAEDGEVEDGDSSSSQPIMRGRYYRAEDHSEFLNWVKTTQPLELEIGSGKGLFLTNAAKRTPNHRFVGLELAAKYALECQARIEKIGLPNARFFACDAVAVLDQDVADCSIDAVHVYFPDPWWKSRHKKRRVLNEKSLRNIQRVLKPSGSLHFWTDVLDYYEGTLELIDQVTDLQGPFFVSEPPAQHDMDYLTHFERRTRRNGLPVYRSRFVKS